MTLESMMLNSDIVLFLTCFPLWIWYIWMMPEKLIFLHVQKPHQLQHLPEEDSAETPSFGAQTSGWLWGWSHAETATSKHCDTRNFWWKQKDTNTSYILPLSLALVGSSQRIYIYIHKSMVFLQLETIFFVPWICVPKFKHTLWDFSIMDFEWCIHSWFPTIWNIKPHGKIWTPEEAAASHGGRRTRLDCRKLLSFATEPDSIVKTMERNNDSFMGSVP